MEYKRDIQAGLGNFDNTQPSGWWRRSQVAPLADMKTTRGSCARTPKWRTRIPGSTGNISTLFRSDGAGQQEEWRKWSGS
jgi:hypothetical protein